MNLSGRRIHIVGSADRETEYSKLVYAHALVSSLTTALADQGANFLVPFGREPRLNDETNAPSIIFDWTVAESVYQILVAGRTKPSGPNGRLVATLATSRTNEQIPETRRQMYEDLRVRGAITTEFIEPGWNAGAIRRQRLAEIGDIMIGLSGGEGVEHLAIEYSSRGKTVVPMDLQLGASQRDGSGGAARLFERACANPADFLHVDASESATDLLDRTRTRNGTAKVSDVVSSVVRLLQALVSPRVFYVRLLNDTFAEYSSVENFFRNTADSLVKELGYEPLQMGLGTNEFAWMNEAIFHSLHHSSVVLVDLTGLRPNCFMELGYALGNKQKVIITVRDDTTIPFDAFALEAFRWKDSENSAQRLERFRAHWERNINMPSLVRRKGLK